MKSHNSSSTFKNLLLGSLLALPMTVSAAPVCESSVTDTGIEKSFPGLQAGKSGWLFREHDLIESFGPNRTGYNGLRAIQQSLAERGTTLMIVPLPTRGIVHPEFVDDTEFDHRVAAKNYYLYLNRLRRVGLLTPQLDELTAGDQTEPLYFARDHHWTPTGAAVTAQLVSKEVARNNLLTDVPTMSFTTTTVEQDATPGSYARAAKDLCGIEYGAETFSVHYTEAQLDLFADVANPEVVLVGTSNSNGVKHFNFGGFLRQELGVDVLNVATSGGGFDESLIQYLQSPEFSTQAPRLIIWEVPGYYSLNQADFYDTVLNILGEKS